MFPGRMTRREFIKYTALAGASLLFGCAQPEKKYISKPGVSTGVEEVNYFEWYPGVPKVTGENFRKIIEDPKLLKKYPRWNHAQEIYKEAEKLGKNFVKDKGGNEKKASGHALYLSGRPEIVYLIAPTLDLKKSDNQLGLIGIMIVPLFRASLYYLLDNNLHKEAHEYQKHYPFSEIIKDAYELQDVLRKKEESIKSFHYPSKLTPETAEKRLKEYNFYLPALDPRRFKENEDVEDHTVKLLEKEGFSDKTIKIWLEDWAELGKRNKLEGFFSWPEDFRPTDKEPGRYREAIVIGYSVGKKLIEDYYEEIKLSEEFFKGPLGHIDKWLLYLDPHPDLCATEVPPGTVQYRK